jgi:hypothetical protein
MLQSMFRNKTWNCCLKCLLICMKVLVSNRRNSQNLVCYPTEVHLTERETHHQSTCLRYRISFVTYLATICFIAESPAVQSQVHSSKNKKKVLPKAVTVRCRGSGSNKYSTSRGIILSMHRADANFKFFFQLWQRSWYRCAKWRD